MVKQGMWQDTGNYVEQEFYKTEIYLIEDFTQSVCNICIEFDT